MRSKTVLCAAFLFRALPGTAGDAPATVPVVLALEDQANEIWSALPDAADDSRVVRLAHTSAACAADALRQAKSAIERGQAGRLALRTLALEVPLPRTALTAAGAPSAAHVADLFGLYVRSSSEQDFVTQARGPRTADSQTEALGVLYRTLGGARSDHAVQPLLGGSRTGAALYEIRALRDQPGRLYLHMYVDGGCACVGATAASTLRRFRVVGQAELEPGTSSFDAKRVTLRWRAKAPRYTVLAACGSCGEREGEPAEASQVAGACGEPCAPLKQATAGWGREASAAEAQVTTLAAQVRDQEAAVAKQRKDRVTAARAELARLSSLADQAKERVGELQRAADEARNAHARCEAQCQAKQRTPDPPATKTAQGGGGGVSTTALVLGGVAAAGAGAAVALRPSNPEPEPAPNLEGTWGGTSLVEIEFQGARCVRAHNETWGVRPDGATYTVDITRTETCGGAFTCEGCQSRAFPALTVTGGTSDGTRFTFPTWHDVFFGPKPCPVTGSFDRSQLSAASTGPCTVLVVPEGPVLHQYRISLTRR